MKDVRIVIGHRGWVWVGEWTQDGDEIILKHTKNIRLAGTTKGFGELVNGPMSGTKLDPVGTLRMHRLAVIASYDANPEKWSKALE